MKKKNLRFDLITLLLRFFPCLHVSGILFRFFCLFMCFNFNFLAMPHSRQDLSSLARDRTHTHWDGSAVLTTGLPGKSTIQILNGFP